MKIHVPNHILAGGLVLAFVTLACSLPLLGAPSGVETSAPLLIPTAAQVIVTSPPPAMAAPTSAPTPAIVHIMTPAEVETSGAIVYDVDSQSTAPEHRAPYGDSYQINRLERPFTQTEMNYLPDIDIVRFRLKDGKDWYYVFVELIGSNPNNTELTPFYGVELDLDRDGHGDYLIWAAPPFGSQWTTSGVKVYTDNNNDTGGASPEKSDAPYAGNGYETLVFDGSLGGADPDLAWVRISPRNATTLQFAFKPSLAGKAFMWGAWADAGLKDVARFSYNDRFTEEEAGSPEKSEKYYPIKQVYAVDNTCRAAFGFKPNGYEPMLCPTEAPAPTKRSPTPSPILPPPPPVPPPP